jgi:hypothetical protein
MEVTLRIGEEGITNPCKCEVGENSSEFTQNVTWHKLTLELAMR